MGQFAGKTLQYLMEALDHEIDWARLPRQQVTLLTDLGLLQDGALTNKGKTTAQLVAKELSPLVRGIPLGQRKHISADHTVDCFRWLHTKITQHSVFLDVNYQISVSGILDPRKAGYMDKNLKNRLMRRYDKAAESKSKWTELTPYAYQMPVPGSQDIIWLFRHYPSLFVAINVRFYDLLNSISDQQLRWYFSPVLPQIIVTKFKPSEAAYHGISALVAPIIPAEHIKKPAIPAHMCTRQQHG